MTIALPPPAALRKGRRRDRAGESDAPSKRGASRSARRNELDALREELSASRRETERLRHQLDVLREQADTARVSHSEDASELAAAKREADTASGRRDAALADLDQSNAAREATLAELQAANATREAATAAGNQALAERDQALAERDQALLERDQALVDLEQERQWREHAARDQDAAQRASAQAAAEPLEPSAGRAASLLANTRAAITIARGWLAWLHGDADGATALASQALGELTDSDDAISSRGAALVMRNAARASIGPEHHAGWLQRTVAVVVLVCVVFALLIVLHLL